MIFTEMRKSNQVNNGMNYIKTIHPRKLFVEHTRRNITKAKLTQLITQLIDHLPRDNVGRYYLIHHLRSLTNLPNDMYNETWVAVTEYSKRLSEVIIQLDTPIDPPPQMIIHREVNNQQETLFDLLLILVGVLLWYGINVYAQMKDTV
jgi:hypothetical protein